MFKNESKCKIKEQTLKSVELKSKNDLKKMDGTNSIYSNESPYSKIFMFIHVNIQSCGLHPAKVFAFESVLYSTT
jgi:hypothetical protein